MGNLRTERSSIYLPPNTMGGGMNNFHLNSTILNGTTNNLYRRHPSIALPKPDLFLSHLTLESHRVEKLKER